MATVITITARGADGKVITKEVMIRGEVTKDDLTISTRTVNAPAARNPFYSDAGALSIADMEVNMRVRMHYTGSKPYVESFSALIAEIFENDNGEVVVGYYRVWTNARPFVYGYKEQLARNLGLCPYNWRHSSTWVLDWYVTAE